MKFFLQISALDESQQSNTDKTNFYKQFHYRQFENGECKRYFKKTSFVCY